jgi:hypothetical protein
VPRRSLLSRLVRSVIVVVPHVFSQDLQEVVFTVD